MEEIIEARVGSKAIGFTDDEAKNHPGPSESLGLMEFVEPGDLQKYGIIPELVGRLPVSVHLNELDEAALVRILQEPRNALVKQYEKMFELEDIRLIFDPEAILSIARKTLERSTGARGLRSIIESVMRDIMFELPSRNDVSEVVITRECVESGAQPLLVLHQGDQALEA